MSNFTSHRGLKIAKKVHFRKLPLFKIHFGAIFNGERFFGVNFQVIMLDLHDVENPQGNIWVKFFMQINFSRFFVKENETGKKSFKNYRMYYIIELQIRKKKNVNHYFDNTWGVQRHFFRLIEIRYFFSEQKKKNVTM